MRRVGFLGKPAAEREGVGLVALVPRVADRVMDHQPPIVACEFVDAGGRQHTFIDKVWIFSDQTLDAPSRYPQAGVIHCALLTEWRDEFGRESVRINTTDPDQLESIEGLLDFVVPRDQVTASTSPVNLL